MTTVDIKSPAEQRRELDEEFARDGTMLKLPEYTRRAAAITAQSDPEPPAQAQPAPAQVAKQRKPHLTEEKRARLELMSSNFKAFAEADDVKSMSDIIESKEFVELLFAEGLDSAARLCDPLKNPARVGIAMTLVVMHELKMRDALQTSYIRTLQKRVAELESRPEMRYAGVWSPDRDYAAGECATDGGSVWHCNFSTRDRPGTSDGWTLMVKRGADGNKHRPGN